MNTNDDDDMGSLFRALRKERQQKRHSNLKNSKNLLDKHGINYIEPSDTHIIIKHNNKVIDYWASTGLWIDRATKKKKRGIFPLLKYLDK